MSGQLHIPLSVVLFAPIAVGLAGALIGDRAARVLPVLGALVPLGYAAAMVGDFRSGGGPQYVTDDNWIPALGIHYHLAVDGLNLWLIALTAVLFLAAAAWTAMRPPARPRLFAFHLAALETAVLGALLAQDLALFVLFFDLMLVPVYFLIGQWGHGERDRVVAATVKLVIYTLVGSLLMLAAAVATAVETASRSGARLSFDLGTLAAHPLPADTQRWLFLGFALAFLIKMPLLPLQGWMPDGYRAMPMPVLVVFSGVVSKVAAYGFLRIVFPTFPSAAMHFQTLVLLIALASILYGSVQAFTQTNARLILGYSSMAQLGFITLGLFAADRAGQGAQGALLQMVNHGLVVAPVFFVIVLLAERAGGSEDIRDMGGIAFRAPLLASLALIASLATLAMPGSANFVGEFLILLGLFKTKLAIAAVAFTGVALASVYMLRAFIRALHNRSGPQVESREVGMSDALVLVPLIACILALGVYPQGALHQQERTVKAAALGASRP